MIVSLEIENFKGIRKRQRVDFAPTTLLFGANSAGKSTVLQALHYLHDLLEHGSADVDRTILGGEVIELGGFARLVHRHDTELAIKLRATFRVRGSIELFGRDLTDFPFPDLEDEIHSTWVELTIRHRIEAAHVGPVVESVEIGFNEHDAPLVWIDTIGNLREGEPLYFRINSAHPLIATPLAEMGDAWLTLSVPEPLWYRGVDPASGQHVIGLDDMLQEHGPLPLFAVPRVRMSAMPPLNQPLRVRGSSASEHRDHRGALDAVRTFLEMVVLGTTSQLATALRESLYIGPLRTIPPRGSLYARPTRSMSWADGRAAWDALLSDRLELVEHTNLWLRRLKAGCQVVVQDLYRPDADAEAISENHVDVAVRRLLLDTGGGSLVLPSEVGAGISQVLPIVVAALRRRGGLLLVEQPELHVHPALQVQLGDLFIDSATREGTRQPLLIETHSEHLILRLLRRIRETTEGELPESVLPLQPDDLSVQYVENTVEGVRITRLRVDEQGEFIDRWPKGFFLERAEELF